MKKIQPHTTYDNDTGYPSAIEDHLSRRGFMRSALAGTAATAGLLMQAPDGNARRPRTPKPKRVTLNLSNRYRFKHGNYQIQKIVLQTRSSALVAFLEDRREATGVQAALKKVLDAHSCVDLLNGKKLARLQLRVAKALTKQYRFRTRRVVATPTVVLFVGVPGTNCLGDCAPPVPFCRPPRPSPRRRP